MCAEEKIVELVILRHVHVQFVACLFFSLLLYFLSVFLSVFLSFSFFLNTPLYLNQCRHIFQVVCRYLHGIFCCSLSFLSIFQIHDLEVMLEFFLFNHIKGNGILKKSFIWKNFKHTEKQNCTLKTQLHQLMVIVSFLLYDFEANPRRIQY